MLSTIDDATLMKVATALGEEDAVILIEHLKSVEEITDDEIANKTGIRLNSVRKILYKLYDHSLVSLRRTRDPKTGWFDAGTPIQASVTSPVKGTIFNEYTCSGWTGTGSVLESGRATTMLFTINQPSTITWSWETTYLLAPLLTVIVVPSVLIILAVYLLRRRKWKRNVTEGEPASKEQYDQPA